MRGYRGWRRVRGEAWRWWRGRGGEMCWRGDVGGSAGVEQGLGCRKGAERLQGGLDLEGGQVVRVGWFEFGGGQKRLLVVVHHLVMDGVSWRILLEDLERGC